MYNNLRKCVYPKAQHRKRLEIESLIRVELSLALSDLFCNYYFTNLGEMNWAFFFTPC